MSQNDPASSTKRSESDTDSIAPTEHVVLDDLEGRPHAHLFEAEPMTIRLTLEEGQSVLAHRHPDRRIVLYVVEGELSVTLGDTDHAVRAGEVVRFDGNQDVSPMAREDTVALIVLAERTT